MSVLPKKALEEANFAAISCNNVSNSVSEFKNNLILAPMANVTDVAFRSIAIDSGADAGITELISAKAITYNNKKTEEMLYVADNEKIKIAQIFGKEPEVMAEACKSKYLEKFDIID